MYICIYTYIYIYIYIYVYIYIKQKRISNYYFMLVLRVSCLTQSFSQHSYTNKTKLSLYRSYTWIMQSLNITSAIFLFHKIIALEKPTKILFLSSRKRLPFQRYSNFCISLFVSFSLN